MSARVRLLHRDCLPPHGRPESLPWTSVWILSAVVAVAVLWTIFG